MNDNTINLNVSNAIEASAGTGKTYTIEKIFLDLIMGKKCKKLKAKEILVLTYTESASRELKERIRERLKKELSNNNPGDKNCLEKALDDIEYSDISTIHGFAKRVLDDCFFETSFLPDMEVKEDREWLSEHAIEFALREIKDPDVFNIFEKHFKGLNSVKDLIIDLALKGFFQSRKLLETMKINFTPDIPVLNKIASGEYNRELNENAWTELKKLKEQNYSEQDLLNLFLKAYQKKTALSKISLWKEIALEKDPGKQLTKYSELYKTVSKKINHTDLNLRETDLINQLKEINILNSHLKESSSLLEKAKGYQEVIHIGRLVNKQLLRYKIQNNLISFDDMICRVSAILSSPDSRLKNQLAKKYKVLLLDEFQDTDRWQWQIFKEIFNVSKDQKIFLVGDPKQSIYRFRNADLNVYENAVASITNKVTLKTNYRAAPLMTESLNRLLKQNTMIFQKKNPRFKPVEKVNFNQWQIKNEHQFIKPLHFFDLSEQELNKEEALKSFLNCSMHKIKSLLSTDYHIQEHEDKPWRKIKAEDIAILTRDRKSAALAASILQENNIPVTINSKEPVFQSFSAKAIIYLIQAIANPEKDMLLKKVLLTKVFFNNYSEILNNNEKLQNLKQMLWHWNSLFYSKGLTFLLNNVLDETNLKESLLSRGDEDTLIYLTEIFRIFFVWDKEEKFFTLEKLTERAYQETLKENSAYTPPLKVSGEAVTITTMHASKGLGFPIVFLACFSSNSGTKNNPLKSCHKDQHLIIELYDYKHSNEIKNKETDEEMLELNRLIYVAVTRARSLLFFPIVNNSKRYQCLTDNIWGNKISRAEWIKENHELCQVETLQTFADKQDLPRENIIQKKEKIKPALVFNEPEKFIPGKNSSFTSLAGTHETEESLKNNVVSEAVSKEVFKSSLKAGADSGNLIHEFLEKADYAAIGKFSSAREYLDNFADTSDYKSFKKLITKYSFKDTVKEELLTIVWNVLHSEISDNQDFFCLKDLDERLHEMEFMLPVKTKGWNTIHTSLKSDLQDNMKLHFNEGWLKGYIDLIFKYKNKWFIADWKSNYLGENSENYNIELLEKDVLKHQYHLQYHIYATALYKYLKKNIASFSYEENFGGVFYFYLRGIQPATHKGVYFHKPSLQDIIHLEQTILKEE